MSSKISVKVNVVCPNHLSDYIAENKKHLINELTIVGHFDDSDACFIRSMCNSLDSSGNRTGGQLEFLSLYSVEKDCQTYNSYFSFKNCITLKRIVFGDAKVISADCFSGCISLESIDISGLCFESISGILYQVNTTGVIKPFINNMKVLLKYPSAKKEVCDIKFEKVFQIADYAFEDFKGTDLYVNNATPPACSKDAFYNVDRTKVKIHVPKDAFNSYWSHSVWGEFQIVGDLEMNQ